MAPSLTLSDCLSVFMSVFLFVCLSVFLFVCFSVCLSLSICLCLSPSVCLSVSLSLSLPLCLSLSLSLSLSYLIPPPSSPHLSPYSVHLLSFFLNLSISHFALEKKSENNEATSAAFIEHPPIKNGK